MKNKERILKNKKVKCYEGLDIFNGAECYIFITNMNVKIKNKYNKVIKVISLNDIVNAAIIDDKELVETDKSVIGRGLIGGVLFGGVGLVLGGLSGVGSKVMKNASFLVINYKEDNEDKVITLYEQTGIINNSFMKALNNGIEFVKNNSKCPKCGKEILINSVKCSNCGFNLRSKVDKVLVKIFKGLVIFIIIFAILGVIISSIYGS